MTGPPGRRQGSAGGQVDTDRNRRGAGDDRELRGDGGPVTTPADPAPAAPKASRRRGRAATTAAAGDPGRPAGTDASGFATFLQLEHAARQAPTVEALRFTMVNETRRLLPYRQAVFATGTARGKMRVEAVSGVAVLERNAPYLRWLQRVMTRIARTENVDKRHVVDPQTLPKRERDEWEEWSAAQVLWCPVRNREGVVIGVLWLGRDIPWQEGEQVTAERLVDCYGHAFLALTGGKVRRSRRGRTRALFFLVLVGLVTVMAMPVRQSALAPAEIVPSDPIVVAAPLDGVVAEFLVDPNELVTEGQPLFRFDDTNLRSEHAVAERTLGIAEAELRRATQGAFSDREDSGQVAILENQVRLRRAELAYARELLDRVEVVAETAGVAIFADANDWIGRPVTTGERILQIADPRDVEVRVHLPVADAIVLQDGAEIDLFLDVDPLNAVSAQVRSANYEAELTPDNVLAFRLSADLADGAAPLRIGLQGTAKIYGETVPLMFFLFRRPIAAVRQTIGF